MSRAERRRMERGTKGGAGPPKSPGKVLVASTVIAETFALVDKEGHPRGGMQVAADGMASLALHDKTGKLRAGLAVSGDGVVQFSMTDDGGRERLTLQMEKETPMFFLRDKDGGVRLKLSLSAEGFPGISVWDSSGKEHPLLVENERSSRD